LALVPVRELERVPALELEQVPVRERVLALERVRESVPVPALP
jgi:hypothetical protein